ncbi:MAG: metallophosphoesterase [Candidatus Saccharibacteria bacterium]|nr:metallophosphoesterase [Candidatus Saccharibacteria bacterium]
MKAFHLTTHHFYRQSHHSLKIFSISDIHFSDQVSSKLLSAIAQLFRQHHPTHILIVGDLIDYLQVIEQPSEKQRLLDWLAELGQIAPTIIGFGNHDFYRLASTGFSRHWLIARPTKFFREIRSLPGLHLLDNQAYQDDQLFVLGFTLPPAYYHATRPSFLSPKFEDQHLLIQEFQKLPTQLRVNLPTTKLKFALVHSPLHLLEPTVTPLFAEYDYLLSGHLHRGITPPIINEIWPSTRGFISPTRHLFPKNVRNTIRTNEDKLIINGAITTLQKCTGPLRILNGLFPAYINLLEFSNQKKYVRKPYIKKEYLPIDY